MANFTRLTLTVTCAQGLASQTGTVEIQATANMSNGLNQTEVAKVLFQPFVAGVATFANLACTDDTFVTPTGVTYKVTLHVDGENPVVAWYAMPKALAPGPVDLASLAPTSSTPPSPQYPYVPLSSVGVIGGPAGPLDGGGKIPVGQIPAEIAEVPASRLVSTTAPLTGGGDLSADRTLAVTIGTTAGTVADGGALTAETTRATTAEALKAPLASPALTGTPTAPTPTTGTGIANKAYVDGAAGAYDPSVPVVLKWPGNQATPAQVHHGEGFWPTGNLGAFLWEFWCRYNAGIGGGGYLISDGYGPRHRILYGLNPQPTGNTWDGTTLASYTGSYTAQEGEWLHTGVGWDGAARLWIYVNGIVVGTRAFVGPRLGDPAGNGGQSLNIGGSDHSNHTGCIAQVRGFENQFPLRTSQAALIQAAYAAERSMGARFTTLANGPKANFLAHYSQPGAVIIPDLSAGYNGETHPGRVWGSGNGIYLGERSTFPGPTWITDPTAPFRQDADPARIRTVPTAPSTPVGAKIFDSFSRADTVPTWALPTLGSTEAGSLGPKAWQDDATPNTWGIFDGHAVYCAGSYSVRWVANDSANMDVRVTRDRTNGLDDYGSVNGAGIAFRVQDGTNFLALRASAGTVRLDTYVGGIAGGTGVNLGSWVPGSSTWTMLRVTVNGANLISCYVDDGVGGWTLLGSVTNATFATAVGAGLYAFYGACSNIHYDNFTVI